MFVVKLDELNWLINDIEHAYRYVILSCVIMSLTINLKALGLAYKLLNFGPKHAVYCIGDNVISDTFPRK